MSLIKMMLVMLSVAVIFFFSSRRRHTIFKCDWSSDVCSSDLYPMTGAARMAARAAARIGAGLTTIAVPEIAFPIYAAALTSIMVRPLKQEGDLAHLLSDSRYTACLIGPGAGVNDATRETALEILATARPVLL